MAAAARSSRSRRNGTETVARERESTLNSAKLRPEHQSRVQNSPEMKLQIEIWLSKRLQRKVAQEPPFQARNKPHIYQSEEEERKDRELRKKKDAESQEKRGDTERQPVDEMEEESHNWTEGARIGEAKNPGPRGMAATSSTNATLEPHPRDEKQTCIGTNQVVWHLRSAACRGGVRKGDLPRPQTLQRPSRA